MTTPIEQQIVIAVSSRALFNLESEHHIFGAVWPISSVRYWLSVRG